MRDARSDSGGRRGVTHIHAGLFALSMLFWVALSDQYNALFLSLGAASALLVAVVFEPIVAGVVGTRVHPLIRLPVRLWRFAVYGVWLLRSIVQGGFQVAWIVLNPRVHPEQRLLYFRTDLQSRFARVMVANTISVVPGTLTVRLDGDEFWVHTLVPDAASDLLDGTLQRRIGAIFLEDAHAAIDARWEEPPEVRR
jgi:multicomponent Na+:H+ antiporter subunit E